MYFTDRYNAGRKLADQLKLYAGKINTRVFALPKGGVPVAYEIAGKLNLPLDIFIVRKLGDAFPFQRPQKNGQFGFVFSPGW